MLTIEWLKSIGFIGDCDDLLQMDNGHYLIEVWHLRRDRPIKLRQYGEGSITIGHMATTTRRQMLDTLRGLGFIKYEDEVKP